MKKTILAALAIISLAGCQGKTDYGTPSDAPLPPDSMTSATPNDASNPAPVTDPAKSTTPEEGTKTGG